MKNVNELRVTDLKPVDQDGVLGRYLKALSQHEYQKENIIPFYDKMEKWEEKEYRSIVESTLTELNEMKDTLINHLPEVLDFYNVSFNNL